MALIELPAGRLPAPERRSHRSPTALHIRVPVFSRLCVCCDRDTYHRTASYHPTSHDLVIEAVQVPVCGRCHDHALMTSGRMLGAPVLFVVGGCAVGLGAYYVAARPGDAAAIGMIVVGAGLLAGGAAWLVKLLRRQRAARADGHHPSLVIAADAKRTIVNTTNERLIDELLALNPGAIRRPDRALGRGAIPQARLLRGGGSGGNGGNEDDDGERELTDAEKQRMLDEILGKR